MPDITMCQSSSCAIKEKCYRFTATPSDGRQSYAAFPPPKEGQKCEYFIDVHSKSQVRRLKKQTAKKDTDTDTGTYYDNFVDGNGY